MERSKTPETLAEWFLDEIKKGLRVKEKAYEEQILQQMKGPVVEASKSSNNRADMIRQLGDPRKIGKEISDPSNWIVDIGSPLSPRKEIVPFFSQRGRMILMSVFLLGIGMAIGLFIVKPEVGWVIPGLLLSFIALWAIGISLANNYLGYLGTASDLKRSNMKISTISFTDLKRHVIIFTGTLTIITLIFGASSFFLDDSSISISAPVIISTIAATIISARMMIKEGKKVLDG